MGLADMTVAKWQAARSDATLLKAIRDGITVERNGEPQIMDGYGDDLAPEEMQALVQYARWLATQK